MHIRKIEDRDDKAVANLVRTSLAAFHLDTPGTAYFDPQLDHLSAYYNESDQRDYFVLVDDQDNILGGAGFGEYFKDTAELQKLYIDPKARGLYASYKLMEVAEQGAKQAGYKKIYLETHHNLKTAIHLYRKDGYSELPKPLTEGPHTTMDYFFIKDLTAKETARD